LKKVLEKSQKRAFILKITGEKFDIFEIKTASVSCIFFTEILINGKVLS